MKRWPVSFIHFNPFLSCSAKYIFFKLFPKSFAIITQIMWDICSISLLSLYHSIYNIRGYLQGCITARLSKHIILSPLPAPSLPGIKQDRFEVSFQCFQLLKETFNEGQLQTNSSSAHLDVCHSRQDWFLHKAGNLVWVFFWAAILHSDVICRKKSDTIPINQK